MSTFKRVLPHNGGFCNNRVTKHSLILQAFPSFENEYYSEPDKQYNIFYYFCGGRNLPIV
jgi:hypothetical protein